MEKFPVVVIGASSGGLDCAQGADGSASIQRAMPDSAITAGVAESQAEEDEIRHSICEILRKEVGHDFSGYKEKTFMRRVRRRMQVLQLASLSRYLERLGDEPDERQLLFRDLLIGITNFFRDTAAFDALSATVIPKLFEDRGAHDILRIWVPGCATGEEAYSIAILVREHIDTLRAPPKVQIFATDIDEGALGVARLGRYPEALMVNVTPQRLKRFFSGDDEIYTVRKDIRDMCMFSAHSILREPPFSRLDLISCRNLLIYFGADFQGQAMPVFHFALKPGGYLFLGASENITNAPDLFVPVEEKHRIYRRRDHVVAPLQFSESAGHGCTASDLIERLEQELRETRERLQQTIEEYETAVEELKSFNEKMQSTNKELETSKEELKSVNEELRKVNAELNAKIEEVDRVNKDLFKRLAAERLRSIASPRT